MTEFHGVQCPPWLQFKARAHIMKILKDKKERSKWRPPQLQCEARGYITREKILKKEMASFWFQAGGHYTKKFKDKKTEKIGR